MKLKYLGTGAAEGWPGLFCGCENCEKVRVLGGRNIRTRSQAVVYANEGANDDKDNILVLDFPPDTYMHCLNHGLRLDKLAHLFITHSHHDHYAVEELFYRMKWFANKKSYPLNIYGNETVRDKYYAMLEKNNLNEEENETVYHTLKYFTPVKAGSFTVTPLAASHGTAEENCMLYLVGNGHKTILYAHDTGLFPEATFEYLKGKRLDMISLDCTNGGVIMGEESGHMGLHGTGETKERLESLGCIDGTSKLVVNHFSHNGKLHYDEMVKAAKPYGFEVSYDGGVWDLT